MKEDEKPVPDRADAEEEPRVYKIAALGNRRAFVETLVKGAAVGAAAVVADSCGNNDGPTAPTTTTSTRPVATTSTTGPTWTLRGYVKDAVTGRPIVGASVTVQDGPNKYRSASTDGNGYYWMRLIQGGMTACAEATRYNSSCQGFGLINDLDLDFSLTLRPTTTTSTRSCSCVGDTCSCNTIHYWFPN